MYSGASLALRVSLRGTGEARPRRKAGRENNVAQVQDNTDADVWVLMCLMSLLMSLWWIAVRLNECHVELFAFGILDCWLFGCWTFDIWIAGGVDFCL